MSTSTYVDMHRTANSITCADAHPLLVNDPIFIMAKIKRIIFVNQIDLQSCQGCGHMCACTWITVSLSCPKGSPWLPWTNVEHHTQGPGTVLGVKMEAAAVTHV